MPILSIVQRDIDSGFRTDIEEARPHRIFSNHAGNLTVGETPTDCTPRLSIIVRLIQIGLIVIQFVSGDGYIRCRRVVWGGFDIADQRPFKQIGWGDSFPVLSFISRDVDQTIIAASPEDTGLV